VPPLGFPDMKRFFKIAGLLLLALLVLGGAGVFLFAPAYVDRSMNAVDDTQALAVSDEAARLHERLFVADLHADLLLWARDPLKRYQRGHTDVPRLIEGGTGLQVFAAVTKSPAGQNYRENTADARDRITPLAVVQRWPPAAWTSLHERALVQARTLRRAVRRSEGRLTLIRSRSDLERYLARRAASERDSLLAGLLAVEGLHALDGKLANVDSLFAAGYRMMAPTHFFDNAVAGSAHGTERAGLTPFGQRVVRRMRRLGVLIDVAHLSPQATREILAKAERPVVFSHGGVKGTCPGPRNLSDALVRGIAETGGVVGIGYWEGAVCATSPAATARALRYVADLVGVEHAALGSDFDGTVTTPFDATGLPQVTQALLDEGFSEDEIALVMGGNVLRVLHAGLPE
jgi:microsomal dipeptidase-like Zn-dependent dipeptidase